MLTLLWEKKDMIFGFQFVSSNGQANRKGREMTQKKLSYSPIVNLEHLKIWES